MSSSAFTPSTTTVTNEVPVNVPVVEAWNEEALTWNQDPGLSTSGSYTAPRIKWRRVGSNMEGFYDFRNGGSTAANNVQVSFRLPNNLTIDSTKFIALPASIATVGFARKGSTYEYINYYPTGAGTPSKSIYITGGLNAQFAADYIGGGWFSVPIAEWAGSGTTTLATRAVEEYAYNTNTTNVSNTSAFANGPDGVLFPQITTFGVSVNKRVRFQTSILPTDAIILEYQQAGSGSWRTMSQRLPIIQQGANGYGVDIVNVSGSTTDIDIGFREGGAVTNGATYGANGEAWNAYYLAGWKWRVRKVSGGAQVGYPVSARNIVGDTSGSVVPVGMLGELKEASNLAVTAIYSVNSASVATLSLGTGTWLVMNNISGYHSTRPTSGIGGTTLQITSNGVEVARADSIALYYSSAVAESIPDWYCSMQTVITVPSGSTYNVVSVLNAVQNSGTPSNFATTTRPTDKMRAIRIA